MKSGRVLGARPPLWRVLHQPAPPYHSLTEGLVLKLTEWEYAKTQMAVRTAAKKKKKQKKQAHRTENTMYV